MTEVPTSEKLFHKEIKIIPDEEFDIVD